MDLREQKYVCTLARYGSITKSAEQLFISQPALSVYISNLEKSLGIKLFNRIGKHFTLTSAGEIYVKTAIQMLSLESKFNATMSDIVHGTTGTLRIGMYLRRTPYLLPAVLSRFYKIHPQIEIDLHEADFQTLSELLISGQLDLFLSNMKIRKSHDVSYIHLFDDRLLLAVKADHPLLSKAQRVNDRLSWIDLKLFEKETFIVQCPDQSTRVFTDDAIAYSGIKPQKYLTITNMETACQMAAEGLGVSFNMESYAKHFQYSKPVKFFLVGDPNFKTACNIAFCKNIYLSGYMQNFIEIMRESCSQLLF